MILSDEGDNTATHTIHNGQNSKRVNVSGQRHRLGSHFPRATSFPLHAAVVKRRKQEPKTKTKINKTHTTTPPSPTRRVPAHLHTHIKTTESKTIKKTSLSPYTSIMLATIGSAV